MIKAPKAVVIAALGRDRRSSELKPEPKGRDATIMKTESDTTTATVTMSRKEPLPSPAEISLRIRAAYRPANKARDEEPGG